MVTDLVCGMQIDETKASEKSVHNEKTYYFCSPSCKAAFDKEPEKYGGRSEDESAHSRGQHPNKERD